MLQPDDPLETGSLTRQHHYACPGRTYDYERLPPASFGIEALLGGTREPLTLHASFVPIDMGECLQALMHAHGYLCLVEPVTQPDGPDS